MPRKDPETEERKKLYFDLICGIICSITALTGIIFITITQGITDLTGWLTGLIFWCFYLVFSFFLIGIGLYSMHKERKYGIIKSKKELRPPIV